MQNLLNSVSLLILKLFNKSATMFGQKFPLATLAIGCILVAILQKNAEAHLFPPIPFHSGLKPCPTIKPTADVPVPPFLPDMSAGFKDMFDKFASFGKELSSIKAMLEQIKHKMDQAPAPVPAAAAPARDAAIDAIPAAGAPVDAVPPPPPVEK